MKSIYNRFKRTQKAAELRAKELEVEKDYYRYDPVNFVVTDLDEEDPYPFEPVSVHELSDSQELMSYVDDILLDEEA